jgi:mannitol-1-phosphate 5-dehydrogenase
LGKGKTEDKEKRTGAEMKDSREKEIVVIMGAGLSGRGYLARQLDLERYELVFLDKNRDLVERLVLEGSYEICFFGEKREKQVIKDYQAYMTGALEGERLLQSASYLFICVGQEHLEEASAYAAGVLGSSPDRLRAVIAAENGTDSLEKMRKHFCFQDSLLTECLMLCTTTGTEGELTIWSEDMDYLPYDSSVFIKKIPFKYFVPCENFSSLVRRKIYTYNTLSACIAYLGAYKGYTNYGHAAMDPEIFAVTEQLECALNQAVCQAYQVDEQEQAEFSALAKQKFRNQEISDTVSRNARNVLRKLGPGERIAEPFRLMKCSQSNPKSLILTAAAAMFYGVCQEGLEETVLAERLDAQMKEPVMECYNRLKKGISVAKAIE